MAAPVRAVANAGAVIADVNQLIDLLEGVTYDEAFLLKSSTGQDFIIRLSDAAGARKWILQDSTGAQIAAIDSSGNLVLAAGITQATFLFPLSAAPAQTASGSAVWDTVNTALTVGTGAARKVLGFIGTTIATVGGVASAGTSYETSRVDHVHPTTVATNTAEQTTTSAAAVDLVTVSSLTIPVTQAVRIIAVVRKSAAAAAPSFGLKINATVVHEASGATNPSFNATNEAQDGIIIWEIAPRSANYLHGIYGMWAYAGVSATATPVVIQSDTNSPLPNATITSIAIRAISNGAQTAAVKEVYVYAL